MRGAFAAAGDSCESERVRRERWRRQPVPPSAPCRRAHPAPPPRKARGARPPPRLGVVVASSTLASSSRPTRSDGQPESEPEDVIDLGAPRLLRRVPARATARRLLRAPLPPNPRLYPGPLRAPPKRVEGRGGGERRRRRRKRAFHRVVPNSRLYQPAPPRPEPPPARPCQEWPSLAPSSRLETASRAALHVVKQRQDTPLAELLHATRRRVSKQGARSIESPPLRASVGRPQQRVSFDRASHDRVKTRPIRSPPKSASATGAGQPTPVNTPDRSSPPKLVVTLPPATVVVSRYKPKSEYFRYRTLDAESGESTPVAGQPCDPRPAAGMEAGNRHSTSPEDFSDGNETLSAPSEFLAEFLSAIMRRQYAEALKYCRLILQYEPHNATARGFYPLLQHKLQAHQRPSQEWKRGSSSEDASAPASDPPRRAEEMMEQGGDSSGSEEEGSGAASRSAGSCGSQSSLELDSSEAAVHSSPSPSLSLSRRTEHTDSASGGRWESSPSRSDADDNGNAKASSPAHLCTGDLENDNAAATSEPLSVANHKSESAASLRRLRAQFTCSIK